MVIRRAEIWWADLAPALGSGPGFRRPVLVVQDDAFNQSDLGTVVVLAITSNLRLAAVPLNIRVEPRDSGLAKPSVVNVSQVITLNKNAFREHSGTLPASLMRAVDDGLLLFLELR